MWPACLEEHRKETQGTLADGKKRVLLLPVSMNIGKKLKALLQTERRECCYFEKSLVYTE
jgi:hypothetical protein